MEEKKHHYTYIIINQENGMMYIGTRSCNVNPMFDIGVKYFSSSSNKEFIKDQKENKWKYSYQVLKEFEKRKEAVSLEIELHQEHEVGKSDLFYNKCKQTATGFDNTGNKEIALKISNKIISSETREKMSRSARGKVLSKKTREKIGKISKRLFTPKRKVEQSSRMKCNSINKGRIWVNDGVKSHIIAKNELSKYLDVGFERGRVFSEIGLGNMKKSKPMTEEHKRNLKGSKTEAHKKKLSESAIGRVFVNKDGVAKRIQKNELNTYLGLGWKRGLGKRKL